MRPVSRTMTTGSYSAQPDRSSFWPHGRRAWVRVPLLAAQIITRPNLTATSKGLTREPSSREVDHADGLVKDQLVAQRVRALEHVELSDMQQVERSTGDAIDVVIAWVDGSDRKHRAKRKRYLADPGGDARPSGRPTMSGAFRTMTRSASVCARSVTTRRGSARSGW